MIIERQEDVTPAVLKEYAAKFDAGPGWLFLTGKREDIDLISRKTGLYSPPNPSNPDGHTPHLLVGNEATGQWLRNSGVDDPRFLATTIGSWLNSWKTAPKAAPSYADAPKLKARGACAGMSAASPTVTSSIKVPASWTRRFSVPQG